MDPAVLIAVLGTVVGVGIAIGAWLWPRSPVPWQDHANLSAEPASSPPGPALPPTILVADRGRLTLYAFTIFLAVPALWILLFGGLAIWFAGLAAKGLWILPSLIALIITSYVTVRMVLLLTQPLDITVDHNGIVMRMAGRRWAFHWNIIRHATLHEHRLMSSFFVWTTLPKAGGIVREPSRVWRLPGFPAYVPKVKAVMLVPASLIIGGVVALDQAIERHARFNTSTPVPSQADEKLKSTLAAIGWVILILVIIALIQKSKEPTVGDLIDGILGQ